MLELTADVSNLTTHILSCQPPLNTKTFRTQIRELKSEITSLKAQHGLRMLDLFHLDYQKIKPAVPAPATVRFASLFDSGIICDFPRCSQCSEEIVLKFWSEAITTISVPQRFKSTGWSLRYSDRYFECENKFLRLPDPAEKRITNGERKKWKDDSGLMVADSLKCSHFRLTNLFNLTLQIFPLATDLNDQTICCYFGWNPHFIEISPFANCNSNAFREIFTLSVVDFRFLSASDFGS
jgi:hypothetical protein